MTAPVCFIARADRGDRVRAVRLLGDRLDQSWQGDDSDVSGGPARIAEWVSGALKDRSERRIGLMCVDVEGGFVSWQRAHAGGARLVETLVRASEGESLVGVGATSEAESGATGIVPLESASGSGATVQALLSGGDGHEAEGADDPARGAGHRLAVMALRDATVRLTLDELDRRSIDVEVVTTLWHALCLAWDPSGPTRESRQLATRVVAESRGIIAIVLIDPSGRLVWSWSEDAALLAAGTAALPRRDDGPAVTEPLVGRVAAEWLAWVGQIGKTPGRVLIIGPRSLGEHGGLDGPGIGGALTRSWPHTSVDLALVDDPIGETLDRLSAFRATGICPPEDPGRAAVDLSHRPGRAHRSMYRWLGLILVIGAVILGMVAWTLSRSADRTRQAAAEFKAQIRTVYEPFELEPASGFIAVENLRQFAQQQRETLRPAADLTPAPPILAELETMMLVLPDYFAAGLELRSVVMNSIRAEIVVAAPQNEMFFQLWESLATIGGSALRWSQPSLQNQGRTSASESSLIEARLVGAWERP
ncbi:MAG: hypothetical protein H6811_03165 [Phycisphaeraceae bacterium]|nr:hypothetical protein [Phycisphaeraceae bacterium]